MNTILSLLDEDSRFKIYEGCLARLEDSDQLRLDDLRICIELRSSSGGESKACTTANEEYKLTERLCDLILARLPEERLDSDIFYQVAELLCSHGRFANVLFQERIQKDLIHLLPTLRKTYDDDHDDFERKAFAECTRRATAYLTLLKCSYWLPKGSNHIVGPDTLEILSRFIGLRPLDELAHDAISALLSLLRHGERIVVAHAKPTSLPQWLRMCPDTHQPVLVGSIIDDSLWDRFQALDPGFFKSGSTSSRIFRTWFQWISQAAVDHVELKCIYENTYWNLVRNGLLYGHADQRKYCLAIIHQSLLAAQRDIDTVTIQFRIAERDRYIRDYDSYAALFETIVLDRYANQVQACLPELAKLLKSSITPSIASTLLSASLHPTVQEGVRKIIGNWYINYVVQIRGDVYGHLDFFLTGFLPWATAGELFTSTLVSTREHTFSTHGEALADVVVSFVTNEYASLPPEPSASRSSEAISSSPPQSVIAGILDFILDVRGKIFQFSILYLLKGLVNSLGRTSAPVPVQDVVTGSTTSIIDKIVRVSRLPGLPEITSDLCKEYCYQLCSLVDRNGAIAKPPGYEQLRSQALALQALNTPIEKHNSALRSLTLLPPSLRTLRNQLEETSHRCIQAENYAAACQYVITLLDKTDYTFLDHADLYAVLDALWEEADRRQFARSVAVHVPAVIFHPAVISTCILQQSWLPESRVANDLSPLLTRALDRLQSLADGRSYVLSLIGTLVRKAAFTCPAILKILPFDDFIIRFLNSAPMIKSEFMFEVAAAEELQKYQPHRAYYSYYGQREWHAYAAMIDLIQRFPQEQASVAKNLLDRLLGPWRTQRAGIPIISKWKNVLQLQAMLLLVDFCITESDVDDYLVSFRHALVLEPWPRYRYLLEWIIARTYYKFPGRTSIILQDLANLDENSSSHLASLMKLAVLVAPHESESFTTAFMTQLVPFSASPKVQIRHESNYAIPIIFDLAVSRGWTSVTDNPAFVSLDGFIRSLDKFQSAPWTIRTLKLDAVKDYTLVNIFQGQYLTIESPEKERLAHEDFLALQEADRLTGLRVPPERISLGDSIASISYTMSTPNNTAASQTTKAETQDSPAFFQTKSGFSIASFHPQSGPPSIQNKRPASVILVASLIDNPTNLGGLSRISESFGLEALHIDDLRKTAHKDFKATSVTSEKHLPIHELKIPRVPAFLLDMKRNGYQIVGIEQTDRSGVLGTEDDQDMDVRDLGTLPKKCVLVLGSEKGGISADVLAVLDRCVEIRTIGVTRSLNVQTAGGIAVYEWWREWYGKN
ncbi:hypothetical protein EK21DRAFT_111247 [Setomelanomma holmii]|uniref:tRNA/rRNA methyltransferase SpoU type domain-containing protein n=1 Tax=Setomelanomma holmii TaxID=210430 RepID=A0A9P4HA87_9PLEO|nr:hypothetical protein EK21DRAFT_111247 [Setomelanomma holmii]